MFVDYIRSGLNKRYEDVKKKFKYKKDWNRRKAVEIYIEKDLEPLYDFFIYLNQKCPDITLKPALNKKALPKIISVNSIFTRTDAYSSVAIRILSILFDCNFDKLYDIYDPKGKKTKSSNLVFEMLTAFESLPNN